MNTKPHIAMQPIRSSNIESLGYHAATNTLAITFKSGGTYHYPGVPQDTFTKFLQSSSPGTFFHQQIKGKHEGVKT